MATAPVLLDRPERDSQPKRRWQWLRRNWKALTLAFVWLFTLALAFEFGHWVQSGMGFTDHMGHMVEHFAALFSTGNWNGYDTGVAIWRRPWAWMWGDQNGSLHIVFRFIRWG